MAHTDRTFYPLPGQFQDRPMRIMVFHPGNGWAQIVDHLSYVFGADPNSLGSHDCYWGDEAVDVLTVNGEIVGSFDRALSASEWDELLSVSDNVARARAA